MSDKTVINNWTGGGTLQTWPDGEFEDGQFEALSAHPHASDCDKQGETRPANCRFRLQDEGKSYPRSSCSACGKNIATGLGNRCKESPSDRTADCDKQGAIPSGYGEYTPITVGGSTTKSEGGVEGHARSTKADSARGEAGSAPSQDGSLAQLAAGIESGPSDRTADVTVEDIALVLLDGLKAGKAPIQIARDVRRAFTVGRW